MEDITVYLIFWAVGFVVLPFFYKLDLIKQKRIEKRNYFDSFDYESSRYSKLDREKLREIAKNLNTGYPILLGIYGILLAFVVSQNIQTPLTNWHFIIWSGWILAIITRSGMMIFALFDLGINEDHKTLVIRIEDTKQFFKQAVFFLIPTVAVLPMIYQSTGNTILHNMQSFPSYIAPVSLAIGFVWFVFYLIPLRGFGSRNFWGIILYMSVFFTLMIITITPSSSSPLDPISISIGQYITTIPSSEFVIIKFGMLFFILLYGWFAFLIRPIDIK